MGVVGEMTLPRDVVFYILEYACNVRDGWKEKALYRNVVEGLSICCSEEIHLSLWR